MQQIIFYDIIQNTKIVLVNYNKLGRKYSMSNKKSIAPKIVYFAIISIAVIIVLLSVGDVRQMYEAIKSAKIEWLIVTALVLLLYVVINQIPIFVLARADNKTIKYSDAFLVGSTEYFFNGITPFASGGQPFQVYAFSRIGIKASRGTGIVLLNYVCYQISIVVMCLLSLVFYPRVSTVPGIKVIVAVGIIINVIVLVVFLCLGFTKSIRGLIEKIVNWFFSWKIFKGKLEQKKAGFAQYCEDVQASVKSMFEYKLRFTIAFVLKLIATILYYCIPFFLLRALNVEIGFNELPFICAMTTFAVAMSCFIPTPGSSGGIELAFSSLFSAIKGVSEVAFAGLVLWRLFTYYLLMAVSFVIYLIFEKKISKTAQPSPSS